MSPPWETMGRPKVDEISAQRVVDSGHDFWWFRNNRNQVGFQLRAEYVDLTNGRLPSFQSMSLERYVDEDQNMTLRWTLLSPDALSIFAVFASAVISEVESFEIETGLKAAVAATRKWERLFREGVPDRLSIIQQMGLLGELKILAELVGFGIACASVVEAWHGPLGLHRDFLFGDVGLEIKARGTTARSTVRISSEHQLVVEPQLSLFLVAVDIEQAGVGYGICVTEMVEEVRTLINDEDTITEFERRLALAKYSDLHDYESDRWTFLSVKAWTVSDAFPAIRADGLPAEVSDVGYTVSTSTLGEFEVSMVEVFESLGEGGS